MRNRYLDVRTPRTADKELELVLQGRDYRRLHRDEQVPLLAGVLHDDHERVVDVAVDAAVGPQEPRHGRGRPEEPQRLVDRVGAFLFVPAVQSAARPRQKGGRKRKGGPYLAQRPCPRRAGTPCASSRIPSWATGSRSAAARRGCRPGRRC